MAGLKKIAVLVSGGGTNLQALIDACGAGIIKSGRITVVISSSPTAYALKRAETAGIETYVVEHTRSVGRDEYSDAILEKLTEYSPDLIVLSGFMYILNSRLIEKYSGRIVNVHPALIPSFCGEGYYGLRVHRAALDYGVKITGATVHFVSEVTDGGPIILQKAVEIREGDTPETLQRRVMEEAEWNILPRAVELICAGKVTIDGRVTHIKEE